MYTPIEPLNAHESDPVSCADLHVVTKPATKRSVFQQGRGRKMRKRKKNERKRRKMPLMRGCLAVG